jgi:type I restriction enzyme M protein
LVLKKSKNYNHVLFINAEKEFERIGKNNRLRNSDIEKILTKFTDREDEEYFSRLVPYSEIVENNYELSVTSYVVAEDKREIIDIVELNTSISEIVSRQSKLRKEIDQIIESLETPST